MKKLLSILFVFALCMVALAGEKRIVGARVNNQVMLLRVDLANYAMDASTDGANWNAIPGTSGIADNALSLSKLAQISSGSILGNVSGSTGNVTTLSASDLKTLIGDATTSAAGLMSSTDKTTLGTRAASGANSDITSLSGLTTALSVAQGGTGLSSLGTAGQVLAVNAEATGTFWTTVSGSGIGDVTGPSSSTDSNLVTFDGTTGKIIKDSGVSSSSFATAGANSNITSLSGLTTPLSVTQGGTGLNGLGTAGQVLTVNSGATAAEWKTLSSATSAGQTIITSGGLARWTLANSISDSFGSRTLTNSGLTFSEDATYPLGSRYVAVATGTEYASFSDTGLPSGAAPKTYSVWIKTSATSRAIIMAYGTPGQYKNIDLEVTSGGYIGYADGDTIYPTTKSVSDGLWHHVALVFDGTVSYKIYVDGDAISTMPAASVPDVTLSGGKIARNLEDECYFSGSISDARIYNRALSSTEILSIYTGEAGTAGLMSASDKTKLDGLNGLPALGSAGQVLMVNTSATAAEFKAIPLVSTGEIIASGGIAKWVLNNSLSDTFGTYTLTNNGITFSTDSSFPLGSRAVSVFDGTSDDASFSPTSFPTLNFTICAWVKCTSNKSSAAIITYGTSGTSLIELAIGSGKALLYRGGTLLYSTISVNDGTWHHITGSFDGESLKIYIDGIQDASVSVSSAVTFATVSAKVGNYYDGTEFFEGSISDIRVYDRPLSSSEIQSIYAGELVSAPGLMSSADKTKLDGLPSSAITAPASPAQGDILYFNGTIWEKLSAGTSGQYLQTQGASANPQWATVTGTGTGGLLKASGSGYALDNGSTGRGTVGTKSVSLEYSESGSGFGATGIHSVVSGGMNNTASGNSSTVGGGFNNTASMGSSTVGGGSSNTASDVYATVGGGGGNTASNNHATVVGGFGNNASGDSSTVGGGSSNTASGAHSFASGQSNTASAPYSMACGYEGVSSHYGGFSWAAGRFSAFGDSQKGWVSARISTSSTDATILYLDGSSKKFTLVPGDHYSCRIHMIGAQADGSTGDYYALVKIKNYSGTTSLSGTVRVLEAWEGDTNLGTPTISITADDTNDCLQVSVTPANATATRWTAVIEYVKINY